MSKSIDELKEVLLELIDALEKRDTEQDGNWGHKSFHQRLAELKAKLRGKDE